jgi:flagellar biosynthesis protein FlhA
MDSDLSPPTRASRTIDIAVAVGVVGIIIVLLVPIPTIAMDILISFNISLSILTLLTILHARKALDLSTFPSILLLVTLLRLALNVASTRLILLKADAGSVILAFGDFVVGGQLLVGAVVFLILIVIQFVVITKGAGRISEVAARFTLDGMPGKQMAIDADLNSGLITEADARIRREEIQQEAEFYGAMDGASKFIRGEAIAGLIITVVNVLGGIGVGLSQGVSLVEALKKYSLLTIGDGLVTQIPALFVSVAAGILVTKASSKAYLPTELASQFLGRPKAVGMSAVMVLLIGLLPGLPKIPFFVLSGLLGLAYRNMTRKNAAESAKADDASAGPKPPTQEELEGLLLVDRVGIELGYQLVPIVHKAEGGGLLEHITNLRKQFIRDRGFVVPPIRVRDNLQIDPGHYRILLGGQEVASGNLKPGYLLALGPEGAGQDLGGVACVEPTFGLPALWIPPNRKSRAEMQSFTVVEPVNVLVTHITEILKTRAHEILTRDDVQALVDNVKEHSPIVVNELIPELLGLGDLQKVLQNLLREGVSILNLPAILEGLADHARTTKDPELLTEMVRQRLCHTICNQHQTEDGEIQVITLGSDLETKLSEYARQAARIGADGLHPGFVQTFLRETSELFKKALNLGKEPVILVRSTVRRLVSDIVFGAIPKASVLSYNEVAPARKIQSLGVVNVPYQE